MSDSREAPVPDPPVPASAPAAPELVSDLFAGPKGDHADDTPTIISKLPPASDPAATSLRGRHLAHFQLIEPIGIGGMAAVIRARDLHLDRSVALKILPPEMAADQENIRRFHQEARAAARLDHENIARVFFCGEDQRLHFIAFEFVEGENLRVLLERQGRLPVPEAIHYMLQVATGLAHAASRGVVHRDIKPSNIIVTSTGRAKLVDMGLARSLEPQGDKGLTQSGVTLGTFDYISPEQALEPRDADVRSDIYSLGCTFYHMLTGQAPVPEGTAARKLHHHQHVAPIDPRQLNPAIPDDVAAILARMMAKDAKDRYQKAEHLVQHLIQVAQKLGAVSEAPDGVLFVDAPLPSPPRKRPLLMAGLAVLALSGLIAVLSLAPTEAFRPTRADNLDRPSTGRPLQADRQQPDARKIDADPPEPREQVVVRTWQQWADALADRRVTSVVVANSLSLNPDDLMVGAPTGGLIFRGGAKRALEIRSADPSKPCTIRVARSGRLDREGAWTGLNFVGGRVTLRDLHFEIDGKLGPAPDAGLAALSFARGNFTLINCWFVQKDLSPPTVAKEDPSLPVASVVVRGSANEPPDVHFEGCYFESGLAAVALTGPATIRAKNCAFGPHTALFHLRGGSSADDTTLNLTHCSALVVDGPAFRLDDSAGCRLEVKYSVFSRPGESSGSAGGPQPDLIFQSDTTERNVCYVGTRNVYHNLNAFWVRRPPDRTRSTLSDFRDHAKFVREVKKVDGGQDKSSEVLADINPWTMPTPLADAAHPERAFQLNVRRAELRTEDDQNMVGIQQLGKPLYPQPLLPTKKPNHPVEIAKGKVRIVDPDPKAKLGDRVHNSLDGAVAEAKPGDEIQIKYTGEVAIRPIMFDVAVNLTIKAHADYRPILILDEKTTLKEAPLFRLHDGQVRFEKLEFLIKPNKERDFQTFVEMIGNGSCTFSECVFTLLEADRAAGDKRPSVVRLTDPGKAMKMAPQSPRPAPEIRFQDCLVRGQGDLVAVLPSRSLDLDLANAVVALDGCLLSVDGTVKDPPLASPTSATNQQQVVKLANVTTYLTEPLLCLRAKKGGKGLVPTAVKKASDCLFVAAGGSPLILLDNLDSREQMERLISWEEGHRNAYVKFEKMVESPFDYDLERWTNSAANIKDDARFFTKGKKIDKPLSQVVPSDFRDMKAANAKMDLAKYGCNLDQLPKPTPQDLPESDPTEDND